MIIKLFDNIASSFSFDSNRDFLPSTAISGYNAFNSSHVGSRISYLARNVGDGFIEFESGIGDVISNNGNITVQRTIITASSNSNQKVEFSTAGTKSLYISSTEVSAKTGYNNVLEKNSSFTAEDYQTTYIVDVNSGNVTATLPESVDANAGLIISLKTTNTSSGNQLIVAASASQTIDGSTNNQFYVSDTYVRYISTGSGWQSLQQDLTLETGVPRGDTFALQHNAGGGNFGANSITTNANGDLNIGTTTTISATGNNLINQDNNAIDTIIYGSDNGKNLYVGNDGNIGINIPDGYTPQAPLHIIQGVGAESIRVENRQNDTPSAFTLYHRPSTAPVSGDINGVINLAGKDSISAQSNYSVLKSKILNSNNGVTTGAFDIDVQYNGSQVNVASLSRTQSTVGSDNTVSDNNLVIGYNNIVSGSGSIVVGDTTNISSNNSVVVGKDSNSINVSADSIDVKHSGTTKLSVSDTEVKVEGQITANSFALADGVADGMIVYTSGNKLVTGTSNINSIFDGTNNGVLIKTGDGQASASDNLSVSAAGDFVINSNVVMPLLQNSSPLYMNDTNLQEYTDVVFNADNVEFNTNTVFTNGITIDPDTTASNYAVLTHTGNGAASWQNINLVDVVIDNADIKWNKYTAKSATVTESRLQLIISELPTVEEFSIGDDIAIVDQDTIYYNTITNINTAANIVITLGTALTGTFTTCNVYSLNKGGYLDIGLNHSSDNSSTKNTISNRAGVATVFNSKSYDIDYMVNGAATNPALHIKASSAVGTDHSPISINTDTAQTMTDGSEATLTVSGGLYASKLESDNIYLDGGIIEFNG